MSDTSRDFKNAPARNQRRLQEFDGDGDLHTRHEVITDDYQDKGDLTERFVIEKSCPCLEGCTGGEHIECGHWLKASHGVSLTDAR